MSFRTICLVSLLATGQALSVPRDAPEPRTDGYKDPWNLKSFKSLVTFGDSYTDETRLSYFYANGGSPPPVGWEQPQGLMTSTGGRVWPRYVVQYTGVNLYNYAVSGAICSSKDTPLDADQPVGAFPDVEGYEVPAFLADAAYILPNGTKFMQNEPDETVYAIWIGTNDLGNDAYLTDSQVPGNTLTDYVDCVYNALDAVYQSGGRYFVLMNVAPLHLLPQYSLPESGGLSTTKFWPNKGANITEISFRMLQQVVTINDIYDYRTPYEVKIKERYSDAHFAVYDTYGLISDMYHHPEQYLNGTKPLNVTGVANKCSDFSEESCVKAPNPDSFLWWDELHPGEQTDRIVAQNFVEVTKGTSKWATYWS